MPPQEGCQRRPPEEHPGKITGRSAPPALHAPREGEVEEDGEYEDDDGNHDERGISAHGRLFRTLDKLGAFGGREASEDQVGIGRRQTLIDERLPDGWEV